MKNGISALALAAMLAQAHAEGVAREAPAPEGPYPIAAAGWGPEAGGGLYYSRWAEDWEAMRAAGTAPSLKAMPLGGHLRLSLGTETRLRYDDGRGDGQGMFRNVLGADLRAGTALRLYAELGSGHVTRNRDSAPASIENDNSLQQLFIEARTGSDAWLAGAMLGRQEFADGPRQLVSLGDGPNLHRTWNGVRMYVHATRLRLGAFDLRATRQGRGGFGDEVVAHDEKLQGVNASVVLARDARGQDIYLDPFWIHSELRDEHRNTFGARLWGQHGRLGFDATLVRQQGRQQDRDVEAWGLFAVQRIALADGGWKPRATLHVDVASGARHGDADRAGFSPLYSSSNYLGEGRFLALSNLLLVAPGVAISPMPSTQVSIEYGIARRLVESDAVYAGGMRSYDRTDEVQGHRTGGLLRVGGTWTGHWGSSTHVSLAAGYEHMDAGEVLRRAGHPASGAVYASASLRY
jgi:hypothetical protein